MKPKAKIDCKINDTFYDKGDEVEVQNEKQLQKLIERGFIEPLTQKQIQELFKKTKLIKED